MGETTKLSMNKTGEKKCETSLPRFSKKIDGLNRKKLKKSGPRMAHALAGALPISRKRGRLLFFAAFGKGRHCFRFFLQELFGVFGRHEVLHAHIAAIDHEDVPSMIDHEPIGKVELPVGIAEPSPLGDEVSVPIKFLQPLIPRVRDVDVTRAVHRNSPG